MAEPAFPTREELVDRFRAQNATEAFRRAQQENERLRSYFEKQGVDPEVAEPRDSLFMRALDTIATPGQWVTGAVAKLAQLPEYSDRSFIDAAKLGAEKNITTSDIFRGMGWDNEDWLTGKIPRAVLGFAGDVVLDPTSWLSIGAKGVKVGSKALSELPVALKEGGEATARQLADNLVQQATKASKTELRTRLLQGAEATGKNWREFLSSEPNQKLYKELLGAEQAKAAGAASSVFNEAAQAVRYAGRELPQDTKLFNLDGVEELIPAGSKIPEAIQAAREARVRSKLGLADDVPLDALFDDAAIRLTSPIRSGSQDIPVLTEASRKLFKYLDGPLYNAKLKVGKGLQTAIKAAGNYSKANEGTVSGSIAAAGKGIAEAAQAFPKLFSQKLSAGGKLNADLIEQHRVARAALVHEANSAVRPFMELAQSVGLTDEEFTRLLRASQAGKSAQLDQFGQRVARAPGFASQIVNDEQRMNQAIQATLNTLAPEKQGVAKQILDQMRFDMDRMAQVEHEAGALKSVVSAYLPGLMKKEGGNFAKAAENFDDPSFSFAKTFSSIADAENQGFNPETNIWKLWAYRNYEHKKYFADKEFLERTAFEVGIPKELMDKVKVLVAAKNENVSREALSWLASKDLQVESGDIHKLFSGADGLPVFRNEAGEIMSPQNYDSLAQRVTLEGAEGDEARKIAAAAGINFTPEQRADVEKMYGLYDAWKQGLTGRAGESIVTRAGGDVASPRFMKLVGKDLSPDDKKFFDGVIPGYFKNALEEGLDTRSWLRAHADRLKSDGRTLESSQLYKIHKFYTSWVKTLKKGALQWWPSYHFGNITSIPFLQAEEIPVLESLGDALSFRSLAKMQELMKGKMSIVQKGTGRLLSADQLRNEALQYGFANKGIEPLDVAEAMGEVMDAMGKQAPKFTAKAWNLLGKYNEVTGKASGIVETFGREQLYYKLRQRGYDPVGAAETVQRLMTNYQGGKTEFERRILNNTIFFYSFGKQQAVNTFVNMVKKPGVLTQQLHAIDGVRELLMDPNAVPLPEDLEAEAATIRSRETPARFIGRSDAGLPLLMTGVGMPFDAASQFLNLKMPKNATFGEVLGALGDSTLRSLQLQASALNPVLKKPIEYIFNKNLFFDKPITDVTMRKFASISGSLNSILGYPTDSVPSKFLDATAKELLNASDNGDGTWTVSPARLAFLSVAVPGLERGVTQMNAFQNPATSSAQDWARLLTRTKVMEVDPAKSRVYEENKRLRGAAEELNLATSKRKLAQRRALLAAQEQES